MMRLKALLIAASIMALPLSMRGQGVVADADSLALRSSLPPIVEAINASGSIVIDMPDALAMRLMPKGHAVAVDPGAGPADTPAEEPVVGERQTRAGYRVQIFDDNNPRTARGEAQAKKNMVMSRFPEWIAYVSFNSPYWRVKVGDFTTRADAEAAMLQLQEAFPALSRHMRVVRDRINLATF